jgi:taurine dioxygenase
MVRTEPLCPHFGVEVLDVDLRDDLPDAGWDALRALLAEHGLLLLRAQELTPARHVEVARRFGELAIHVHGQYLVPDHPELVRVSNMVEGGRSVGIRNEEVEWHVDGSWSAQPSAASLLYCLVADTGGGDTLFVSSEVAYATLDPELRERAEGLHAVHSLEHVNERKRRADPRRAPLTDEQRRRAPDVVHPLVREHPVTGRRSLLVGSMVIRAIVELGPAEGDAVLARLLEHATRPDRVYRHRWRAGDLLCWDNTATLHTATPSDPGSERLLHRATVVAAPLA